MGRIRAAFARVVPEERERPIRKEFLKVQSRMAKAAAIRPGRNRFVPTGRELADVFGMPDGFRREFGGRGNFSAEVFAHQSLVKALDSGQQGQFPFWILCQNGSFGGKVPTYLLKGSSSKAETGTRRNRSGGY